MKIMTIALLILPIFAFAKLQIATTTTDLAAVLRKIGQDRIEVFSIAKGTQDPHQIEAKPSFMVKLRSVDLVVAHGLELESAWLGPLIQGARNPKLNAPEGLLEIGASLDPIEAVKGEVTRADGDVHPGGNPHFQLDPIRLGKAAQLIAKKLALLDPNQKDFFVKNATEFEKQLQEKEKLWRARIKISGIKEIVTYHKTFSYFCDRFEIRCALQLEPKPGIPPTASHILAVIDQMKKRKLNLVLIENLYEDSVGQKLRNDIPNVMVRRVPVSVDGEPFVQTNEELIDNLVKEVEGKGT